jgi:hypothetical protein
MNFTKIRNVIAGTAVTIMSATYLINLAPASAQPTRIGQDTWSAYDDRGQEHVIKVEFQDREGDYRIEVRQLAVNEVTTYWIDCNRDIIQVAGTSNPWSNIDHRKMEGWYSDVACRLN